MRLLLVGVQRDLVLEDQENEPTKQNGITKIKKEYTIGYTTVTCMFNNDQQKKSFLTFKERGEPIDREGRGALRRLAGYKRAGKYEMLIFCFVA